MSSQSASERQPLIEGSPSRTGPRAFPDPKHFGRTAGYPRDQQRRSSARRRLNVVLVALATALAFYILLKRRSSVAAHSRWSGVDRLRQGGKYRLCGTIYTVQEADGSGTARCLTIDDGEIVHVSTSKPPKGSRAAASIPTIHLPPGAILTPGLVDSHAHTLQYAQIKELSLLGCKSVHEVIATLEDYVERNRDRLDASPGAWIEGMGWDQNLWAGARWPTADDLEASVTLRGRPIALKRVDIHAEWVSRAVLDQLGELPDHVPGGKILRDAQTLRPTGVFIDDAMQLVDAIRPKWTEQQTRDYLDLAMRDGARYGLTGIHDAGVEPEHINLFKKVALEGGLKLRFYLMRACPDKERYCGDLGMLQAPLLNVRSVKLFGDGALGSWGSAMLEPYSDRPGETGTMRSPDNVWGPLIDEFVGNGWQVNVHCIGDRCNRLIVDAMEAALLKHHRNDTASARLRIEHAQIMTLPDLERAAKLGIIASYQPTHATSDMWYAEQRIGPERMRGAYAWRRYQEAGGRITLGSDFPVESIDPLKGFFAAVTRTDERGSSPMGKNGWYPDQKLTRFEALRGMTRDAAFASFAESVTGTFEPGKRFDAVVWDRDLMSTEDILGTRVLATVVDGRVVYG